MPPSVQRRRTIYRVGQKTGATLYFLKCLGNYKIFNYTIFSDSMLSALYAIVHLSVRPSVTRLDQSKTVEVRIKIGTLYSSHIPLVFCRISFIQKFRRDPLGGGVRQGWGAENKLFSSFMGYDRYTTEVAKTGSCIWVFDWHQGR